MGALRTVRTVFHSVSDDRGRSLANPVIPTGATVAAGEDTGVADDNGVWHLPQRVIDKLVADKAVRDEDEMVREAEDAKVVAARLIVDSLPEHLRDRVVLSDPDSDLESALSAQQKAEAEAAELRTKLAALEATVSANETSSQQAKTKTGS